MVADKIALNNVLAAKAGKYIPLFSDANSASGLVSVTFAECNRLPLSNLMTHEGKSNDGTAKIVYSVTQVQIGSPVVTQLLAIMSKEEAGDSLRGDINNATINIANGQVTQDTTLTFGQNKGRGIRFAGGVTMESLRLNDFVVNLSPTLLKQFSKDLAKYLPDGVDIGLKGLVTSPKLDVGSSINKMFGDAAKKAAVDALTGGNKDKKADPNDPNAKKDDPLGGLGDLFNKDKKKDKDKKKK